MKPPAFNVPAVSVVIPAYNASEFIDRTIESILGQDYPNIECIVVDDASTDATPDRLKSYGNRIRTIRHDHNRGTAAAINTGVAASTGDYLLLPDADDIVYNTTVSYLVRLLEDKTSPTIVCTSFHRIDEHDNIIDTIRLSDLSDIDHFERSAYILCNDFVNMVGKICCMLPRSAYQKFDENELVSNFEDTDWFWRMTVVHGTHIDLVDIIGGAYRVHKNSKTAITDALVQLKTLDQHRNKILNMLDPDTRDSYLELVSYMKQTRYYKQLVFRTNVRGITRRLCLTRVLGITLFCYRYLRWGGEIARRARKHEKARRK